ncbi:MAG: beta strand repeat-containing protein, partial [Candidatus Kapaibacterium sp.]
MSWASASATSWGLTGNGSTNASTNYIGTTDPVDFVVRTNGTERMRVTSVGNVGIGDASPAALFTVGNGDLFQVNSSGNVLIGDVTSGSTKSLTFGNSGSGYGAMLVKNATANSQIFDFYYGRHTNQNASSLRFWRDQAKQVAVLTGDGDFGLGSTAPSQRLHVAGGNVLIDTSAASTAGQLQLMNPARTFQTNIQSGAQTANITYTLPTAAPASNGQMLTATTGGVMSWTSPSASSWGLTGNASTTSGGALGAAPTGGTNFIGTTDAIDFRVVTNNVVRAIVSSAGAISTQQDLTVNGLVVGARGASTNAVLGNAAMLSGGAGGNNVAVGQWALYYTGAGSGNTAVGTQAGFKNVGGYNNAAFGSGSLYENTEGFQNTAIGNRSIAVNTTGDNNTALGFEALFSSITGDGNVALGYRAGYSETGSNKLYIANSSTANLIYGDFSTGRVAINGGSTPGAPGAALQVNSPAAATIGLIVKGAASQSANLIEAQNSSGTAQFSVGPTGATTVGAAGLTVDGTAGTSNVTLTSLSGTAGASVPSGYNRIVLANATGQLQQVATTALVGAPVSAGTTNNSTLRYDNSSTQWLENTSILMTNTGTIT